MVVLDEQVGLKRNQRQIVRHLGGGLPYERHGFLFVVMREKPYGRVDDGRGRRQLVRARAVAEQPVGGIDDAFAVVARKGAVQLELGKDELSALRRRLRRHLRRNELIVLPGCKTVSRGRASRGQKHERKGGREHQAFCPHGGRHGPPYPRKG